MSKFKVGDKVWVLCEVDTDRSFASFLDVTYQGLIFLARKDDCRPVEPDQDDLPVEFKVGDKVVSWSGRQGIVEAINEIEGFPITVRHSIREQVSYKLGGVKHDDDPVEPASCPKIPDSATDSINPAHYKHLPAEAIDIIMAAIAKAPSNGSAFLQGQVIKYLLRCWSKKGIEDLRKAKWYLDRLIEGVSK